MPGHRFAVPVALRSAVALAFTLFACAAGAIDWASAPAKPLVLTYPGQASWEWMLTKSDHEGAEKFRGGKECKSCHDDKANAEGGAKLVKGGKLEPTPVAGMAGSLPIKIQVANDGTKLYVRLSWKTAAGGAGADPKFAARAALMIGNPTFKDAARAGCWAACHDDVKSMASAGAAGQEKYIGATRVKLGRTGGGAAMKPQADIDALLAQGSFLEYWAAGLNSGQPAVVSSGYVLDTKHPQASSPVSAEAIFANGEWSVTFSRALAAAGAGQVALRSGTAYPIGFAVHEAKTDGRFHYVSMAHTLAIDSGSADFLAAKK
jgi:cytochrome c-type protein NapC